MLLKKFPAKYQLQHFTNKGEEIIVQKKSRRHLFQNKEKNMAIILIYNTNNNVPHNVTKYLGISAKEKDQSSGRTTVCPTLSASILIIYLQCIE